MIKLSFTNILVLKFLFVLFFIGETKPTTTKIRSILVFGDSTADPGNNNYITTPLKANFPPYGKDYMQQIPTGRFTNGKLPNDYIAEYLGVKEYVPPYLDPTLSIEELISGVSFASAGSGFDPLTPKITELLNLGAERIGVVGLPPFGCLPIVITLYSNDAITNRGCITNLSSVAQLYNQKLQILLQSTLTQHNLNSRIAYLDVYGPQQDMAINPAKYGFEDVNSGCCGTGILELSYLCNPQSYICSDASKYIYFDSIHPTEKSYNILVQTGLPTIDYITHGH